MSKSTKTAKLALADGSVFTGRAFGFTEAPQPVAGEVVFNTSMSGYQEILTDPSYNGQIVTMTYTQMGNYGVGEEDMESGDIQVSGFVIRELSRIASNYRSEKQLEDWLADQQVLGICDIDTRALTRKLRIDGAMNGVISCSEMDDAKLVELAKAAPSMAGQNLAEKVSVEKAEEWGKEDLGEWIPVQGELPANGKAYRVVALHCGVKHNILRNLTQRGCEVVVLPHDADAETIRSYKPDGLFVSNGPGDPAPVEKTIAVLKEIAGEMPTFGICLGHQLLSLALGATSYKLKFGHRGGNQPVQNLGTKKVEITAQNHGFAIDTDSLEALGCEATHVNLNDNTLAGFRHKKKPIFAVQYHPEASPGPHDSAYLFDCFIEMMNTGQSPTTEVMDAVQRQRNDVSKA